jgi:hypothetical protein
VSTERTAVVLFSLLLLSIAAPAHAGVYDDVQDLVVEQAEDEALPDATGRWRKARDKLDAIPRKDRNDYRYCYLRTVVTLRLEDPAAAKGEREACTPALVSGIRVDGKQTTPDDRARHINSVVVLIETHYQEEVERLKKESTAGKVGGKSKVIVATKVVKDLQRRGAITADEAKELLGPLEDAQRVLEGSLDKIDPSLIDLDHIDWTKFRTEHIDSIPSGVRIKIPPSVKHRPLPGPTKLVAPQGPK